MNGRRRARLAWGLLVLSVTLAVSGTVLALSVSGVALPAGTQDDTRPAIFLWLMLSFTGVGALVAARRPENTIGWLLLGQGMLWQLHQITGDI